MKKLHKYSFLLSSLRRLKRSRTAILGLVFLSFMLFVTIFADFIAPYSYFEQNLLNTLQPPNSEHWFGTDEFGRDLLSRIIYGARISLLIGFVAVSIALVIGGFSGAVAGYYGGLQDNIIMRFMDVLFAIPQLLLAIAIAAALGPGLINSMFAVGLASTPNYARLLRACVLNIKSMEYIQAARASGGSNIYIIFRHILPNCLAPIIVQATLGVAFAILIAAALSFIGLGLEPPNPEWGAMLAAGRDYIRDFPHLTVFPGLAIMCSILALNFLGDGLRDAFDPKLGK